MSFSWTLLLIIIFIISLLFSFTIEEKTLKICYWLVIFLLALTIFNIILSVQYYIDLRNQRGIKGPRGPKGKKGPKGVSGVCALEDECGISNCRHKIVQVVQNAYPELEPKCLDDIKMCSSPDQKEKVMVLQKEIAKLEKECQNTTDPINIFIQKIEPQIESLGGNGNI